MVECGEKKLPSDHELATEITASYATLRLVMKELEQQGYIRRIRGSGTYLTPETRSLLAEAQQRKLYIYAPCFPDSSKRDYGVLLLEALRKQADVNNWKSTISPVRNHREFIEHLEREAHWTDAVIYLPPTEPFSLNVLGKLAQFDAKPLVVLDCELSNIAIDNITTDNRRGGMLAASHLLTKGHRNIAILLCEPPLPQSRARIQGFTDTLESWGIQAEIIDCRVQTEDSREFLTFQTLLKRLKQPYNFTAIFAISDSGAFGALQAFEDLNLVVGRDISLIGFDGISARLPLSPRITSIVQPIDEICQTAVRWLDEPPHSHLKRQLSPVLYSGETVQTIMPAVVSL